MKIVDFGIKIKNSPLGLCRRYAPRTSIDGPVKGEETLDAIWPRTGMDQWCGEWITKIEVEEQRQINCSYPSCAGLAASWFTAIH